MRNVTYFLEEAAIRSQQGFEYVFADIIDVFDQDQTTLTTENGTTMVINWNMAGRYKSHFVFDNRVNVVDEVVAILKKADVDGEMLQEILKQVGMERQLLGQLMATMPYEEVLYEYGELVYARKCKVY